MNNSIILREIRKSDYEDLAKIISETWGYEKFCTSATSRKMGRLYLASCLCQQTFNAVAIKENSVVGIIMGNNIKAAHTQLKYKWFLLKSVFFMILSSEGRKVIKMFRGLEHINENLLKKTEDNFDGELSFFAVKKTAKGTGVGRKLYEAAISYFKSKGITRFYLFTDTSCDFGFYEHNNFRRIGEKIIDLKPYDTRTMTFFLYCKELQ